MSKNNENTLVPKLRFPDFANDGAWEVKKLGEVCKMQAGKFVNASDINEIKAENLFPCYGGNGLRGYTKSFNYAGTYSLIGRQGALCGNVTLAQGKFHATEHAVVVTPDKNVDTLWLFYMLGYLNLNQYATGQAQPGLSVDNLEKIELSIPKDKTEQQKIAACLSSLDDVITAESQKQEVLKEYKKGLLQNLFPQEGENIPKLRFREFEASGEWVEKKLGEVCDVRDGTHDSPKYVTKGFPLITSKNLLSSGDMDFSNVNYISEQDYILINKRSKVDVGDILFGMIGTIGNPVIVKNDGFAIKNVALIKEQGKLKNSFLIHLLKSDFIVKQFAKQNAGGILKFIALGIIRDLEVILPPDKDKKEQQKIASCLSSIDDLINAQSQKIEALKLHKKGLLQGLFPNVNTVNE